MGDADLINHLLTTDEVARILNVTSSKVRSLPIPFVRVGKLRRYRPAQLDEFRYDFDNPWDDEITGRVYFLRTYCGRFVKIGYAMDVSKRVTAIDLCHPEPLTLLGSVPGNPRIEKFFHRKFKDMRVRGEWFRLSAELKQHIQEHVELQVEKDTI
jgi:excisionase family DNA binding protein